MWAWNHDIYFFPPGTYITYTYDNTYIEDQLYTVHTCTYMTIDHFSVDAKEFGKCAVNRISDSEQDPLEISSVANEPLNHVK